ncbi:acyl carrier protein [Streptomyces sp. NBC_00335]|uniref:acyl carrier protein n=1 Tax=unclassified Streptomyces TaxID=2593676 RepID=UPI00224E3BDA|nr:MULTISPECIES: acyl carrier protein [unclassified Streptomyces]MCX5409405.1 acyl carrier protein [Streptomyces sp. NBC_00086]
MTSSAPESTGSMIDLIGEIILSMGESSAEDVHAGARMGDLLTDSLMVVEMAMALQEKLDVKVDEEELRDVTVAEFAALIDARRGSVVPPRDGAAR